MAQMTNKPWNGSASRFSDDEYRRSCIHKGPAPYKTNCSLPVREPDGSVNCNGVAAARAAAGGARGASISLTSSERATLDRLASACQRFRNPVGAKSGVG
jgi:hypothetical protein